MDENNTETQVQDEKVVLDEVIEVESCGQYTGSTKWFNDKLGYGFVTICDGEEKGKDIFVHHTGVKPLNSNYKTLRKGEYIQFNIINGINGLQAVDVTGIKGGPLMCDYVTSKRIGPEEIPQGSTGWQTIMPRRPNNHYSTIPPPPPAGVYLIDSGYLGHAAKPLMQPRKNVVGGGGSRPFKNVAKYNKATRPV